MKIARVETASSSVVTAAAAGEEWMRCEGSVETGWRLLEEKVSPVRFLPPAAPAVIFGIGLNYREHAREMGTPLPEHPVVFMKNLSAATGHLEPVPLPRHLRSDAVDYEVELAVIIGKKCKNVPKEQALDMVAGYTVANDISARDWQKIHGGGQWTKGKSFDGFCPLGPVMVTADELEDPQNLRLQLRVNGERRQDSSTADMIFDVASLIEFLSGGSTLLPGTVILTGTPPGVGAGHRPPRYLNTGDRLSAEITGIGTLENTVTEEPL